MIIIESTIPRFEVCGYMEGIIIPYYRMTNATSRFDPKAKEYLEQKDYFGVMIAREIQKQSGLKFKNGKIIDFPIRVGIGVFLQETSKGEFPKSKGDFDNYVKMFLDAMVSFGIIEDDSSFYYRGSCGVRIDNELMLPFINKHKNKNKKLVWRIINEQ